MSEASDLISEIGIAIDALSSEDIIEPNRIATIVLDKLDREQMSPFLVRLGCHLQLRQLARDGLRRRFQRNAESEPELFELQDRYPVAQSQREEPAYVKRELMTKIDLTAAVSRMTAEASAKLAHRDALIAWWNEYHPDDLYH